MTPIILWFRKDLRLTDNPALTAAVEDGAPILPLYILEEDTNNPWPLGNAQKWWLHHSLSQLNETFLKLGGQLFLKRGNPQEILGELVKTVRAKEVYWNRCYEPYALHRDNYIKENLQSLGVRVKGFKGNLLFEPWEVLNKQGTAFKVYTPFWKECLSKLDVQKTLSKPKKLNLYNASVLNENLSDFKLLPQNPDWSLNFYEVWQPGEMNAEKLLKEFLDHRVHEYTLKRDYPAINGTSRLSPHIHFGEISVRQIVEQLKFSKEFKKETGDEVYLSELGWREFCYSLLYHFPELPERNFQITFNDFSWENNDANLRDWQKGRTGYPIVDAGMRELWTTGWMHNRIRMVVASFLTKHLLLPWQQGEKWFWDTLLDADLASNASGWQWVAGCGADAAPYFRIFNPVLQGEKFDPEGDYVRRFVPELRQLSKQYIHKPWLAPTEELEKGEVVLGKTYPYPIIDHGKARQRALQAYKNIR